MPRRIVARGLVRKDLLHLRVRHVLVVMRSSSNTRTRRPATQQSFLLLGGVTIVLEAGSSRARRVAVEGLGL